MKPLPTRTELHLEVIALRRKGMDPITAVKTVLKKYSLDYFPPLRNSDSGQKALYRMPLPKHAKLH